MCLFIYSPSREIKLEYISEAISLDHHGAVYITTDLLVTNKSSEPINSLNILIPQKIKDYEDITSTYNDSNSPYNKINYEEELGRIVCEQDPSGTFTNVTVYMPNPGKSELDLSYFGHMSGDSTVNYHSILTDDPVSRYIIDQLKMSLFQCNLSIPLEKNKPRWFRWNFSTPHGSRSKRSFCKYFIDTLLDNCEYYFEISGPDIVKNNFFELMCNFQRESNEGELVPSCQTLIREIWHNGLAKLGTKTIINDWRINLYPNQLFPLDIISEKGSLKTTGPSIAKFEGKNIIVYKWKSGKFNIPEVEQPSSFKIIYSAKYSPWFIKTVPYLGVLLGLLGLIFALIQFFSD